MVASLALLFLVSAAAAGPSTAAPASWAFSGGAWQPPSDGAGPPQPRRPPPGHGTLLEASLHGPCP
jgi:hypothetical protein